MRSTTARVERGWGRVVLGCVASADRVTRLVWSGCGVEVACPTAVLEPDCVRGTFLGSTTAWVRCGLRACGPGRGPRSPRPRWRAAPDSAPVPALGRAASAAAPQVLTLSLRVLECVSRVSWGVCWCALRRHPPGSRVLRALGRTGLGPAVPRPVGRVPRALGRARPVPSTACRTPICPRMPWGALVMYLPFSRGRPGARSSAAPGPGPREGPRRPLCWRRRAQLGRLCGAPGSLSAVCRPGSRVWRNLRIRTVGTPGRARVRAPDLRGH